MRDVDVLTAAAEARRFLARVEEREAHAKNIFKHDDEMHAPGEGWKALSNHTEKCPVGISPFNAAVRRASMDLSRALAKVRIGG